MMQRKYRKVLTPHHLLGVDQTQAGMGGEEARKVDIEESVLMTVTAYAGVKI